MRKSKKKLLAMLLAGTMVFGMLPSNVFADNEQIQTSTIVDEGSTIDESTNLDEEDTNQYTTEVEAPVEETNSDKAEETSLEGNANTESAVDLSLEEIKLQKTEEIKNGEKYIIVYDNKKALAAGKDNIIAVPVEIEDDTVKTETTKNMVWTVEENGSIKTEDNKYLLNDITLNDNVGTTLKFGAKSILVEEANAYLTYSEETNEWSFTEVSNEDVTYYNVIGDTSALEESAEEPAELEQGTEGTEEEGTVENPAEDDTAAGLEEKATIKNITVNFYVDNNIVKTETINTSNNTSNNILSITKPTEVSGKIFKERKVNGNLLDTNPSYKVNIRNVGNSAVIDYYYISPVSGSEGNIELNKIATEFSDQNHLANGIRGYSYDIKLTVKGAQITQSNPVEVVLVIDTSGSMDDNKDTTNNKDNMQMTKEAALSLASKLLSNEANKVAIVTYAQNAYAYKINDNGSTTSVQYRNSNSITSSNGVYYTNNYDVIENIVNSLSANDGTNTEAGFKAAEAVSKTSTSQKDIKSVVFMTDGQPTYRINGDYSTSKDSHGDETSKKEFNQAVDAAISLRANVGSIYTVALLLGVTGNDLIIADRLLSSTYLYKYESTSDNVNNISNSINNIKIQKNQNVNKEAYSTRYESITESAGATDKILSIYESIANELLALASGTVSDTIPKEFKLTDGSRQSLLENGHQVIDNQNGSTTIVFKDNVVAGKDRYDKLPIFRIEPNTEYYRYGSKYTNIGYNENGDEVPGGGKFDYRLYTGVSGTKNFVDQLGFIEPITETDEYYTSVDVNYTIRDILDNDPSNGLKLQDNEYTVSDLSYYLVNADGTTFTGIADAEISLGTDGTINFISDKEGTYEFYYVATATASKGEETKTLNSRPTKVTVHVYDIENKVFVIDYGKPVTYSKKTVFNKDIENATGTIITLPESENDNSKCGTLVLNDDKSITYTLNRYMDQIDKFNFNVKIENVKDPLTKIVTIMPATTVYYEDNFGSSNPDGTNGIVFSGNWGAEGNLSTEVNDTVTVTKQDSDQNKNYGYDSNYSNNSTLSGGSATVIKGDGETVNASFTFKGTGFDLISRTNNDTGSIIVTISKVNEDKSLTQVKNTIVNNTYYSGDLYQIPVINFYTEEYATYQVDITVGETVFYLDAIRVYNPLGFENKEANTQYKNDKEFGANIREVRNLLISNPTNGNINGIVYVDGQDDVKAVKTYKEIGPNNEVYLKKGDTIAFKINEVSYAASVQLGVKSADGESGELQVLSASASSNGVTTKEITLNTATDMYYDITEVAKKNGGVVYIRNNSDSETIISITNLKVTCDSGKKDFAVTVDESIIITANMLAYEASNNKSADINSDGAIDVYDLADVANNQDKEIIIGVSTDIYRQDLTGTRTINRDDLNIVRDNLQ